MPQPNQEGRVRLYSLSPESIFGRCSVSSLNWHSSRHTLHYRPIIYPTTSKVDYILLLQYSGTSDNGHSEKWTTSLQWTHCSPCNGHTVHPLPLNCPYISTSEEGTTSEHWTNCLFPMCPLFGGSIVKVYQNALPACFFGGYQAPLRSVAKISYRPPSVTGSSFACTEGFGIR